MLTNIFIGTAALLLIAAVAVWAVGARARARLKAQYPPPGRLVDIGGCRLHVREQGGAGPTVVIEAGQGDFSLGWELVAPQAARFARVVSCDRAGLGWSEPSPRPRTAGVMAEELRALLAAAGVPGPYVLVGASLGGLVARMFAHKYPDDVAGFVFVDSSHEEQYAPEPLQRAMQQMAKFMPIMTGGLAALVGSGLAALRPALLPDPGGAIAKLPKEAADAYRAVLAMDGRNVATHARELRDLPAAFAEMRAARITSLGDKPLVVLRHGRPGPMMGSPEVARLLEETFVALQAELAALSPQGRLIVAEQSGHAIQVDQPELVVQAIREVVAAIRVPAPALLQLA